jgi:hypothetical protein
MAKNYQFPICWLQQYYYDIFFVGYRNVKFPFKENSTFDTFEAQAPRWNDITIFHHLYSPPAMPQQMAGLALSVF